MSEKDNDFIQWLGIKGAIKDYKADRTLENRFKVIGYILKAMEVDLELKTPMTFKEFNGDESDTGEKVWGTFPTIQQIENFYEEQFVPLFTSEEELADAPEADMYLNVPVRILMEEAITVKDIKGVVINPFGDQFVIPKDMVELALDTFEKVNSHEARRFS